MSPLYLKVDGKALNSINIFNRDAISRNTLDNMQVETKYKKRQLVKSSRSKPYLLGMHLPPINATEIILFHARSPTQVTQSYVRNTNVVITTSCRPHNKIFGNGKSHYKC